MVRRQLDLFGGELGPETPVIEVAPGSARFRSIAESLPVTLRLGTSSWSFPGWAGLVYDRPAPAATLARHGLGAYAQHPLLRTVSIDRSFYGAVPLELYEAWSSVVPADFRFAVKIDRACTTPDLRPERSDRSLPNPWFMDAAHALASTIQPATTGLGDRLGLFILQFPPLPADAVGGARAFADLLDGFLEGLPSAAPIGVELRTPELFTPRYTDVLAKHGASHIYTVHPAMRPVSEQFRAIPVQANRMLAVRWMLHGTLQYEEARALFTPFDRLVQEDPPTRATLARACADAERSGMDAFVLINNKAEGSAPLSVARLAEEIGRSRREVS